MKIRRLLITVAAAMLFPALPAGMILADTPDAAKAAPSVQVLTGHGYLHEWSREKHCDIAQASYPVFMLEEETAEAYPKLEEAFDRLNQDKKDASENAYEEILEDARKLFREDPEHAETFSDAESCYVVRSDTYVVSLLGIHTTYTGGVHHAGIYTGVNIDPLTGKTRMLDELVTEEDAFCEAVKKELSEAVPGASREQIAQAVEDTESEDLVWTAGYEGITCYFNEFSGTGENGSAAVLIPYAGNESLFSEEAGAVLGDYGMEFAPDYPFLAGGREILVRTDRNETGNCDRIAISLDGEETVFQNDLYTLAVSPTYLRVNGEDYLYLQLRAGNDYRSLSFYHLGSKPEKIGWEELAKGGMFQEEKRCNGYAAMTDPQNLLLSKRLEVLDIMSVQCHYQVGESGKPEPKDAYFRITGDLVFSAKEDFSFEGTGENGLDAGMFTIPAGTKMSALYTDNNDLMGVRLADGRLVWMKNFKSYYPRVLEIMPGSSE